MHLIQPFDSGSSGITVGDFLSGLPETHYHQMKTWVSASMLRKLASATPQHLRHDLENTTQSSAMTIGTALHTSVLQCELYESQFVVLPEGLDRRTKEGKAKYESLQLKATEAGARLITEAQDQLVIGMTDAIVRHSAAREVLQSCEHREVSLFNSVNDVCCKARFDLLSADGSLIADIKTTGSLASAGDFALSIAKFGYGLQAAFYRRMLRYAGGDASSFIFVVVESAPPHGVACYRLVESQMELFDSQIDPLLTQWRECLLTDTWAGWRTDVVDIVLPKWIEEQARETQIDALATGGAL